MPNLGEILRAHGIADSAPQRLNKADCYFLEVPGTEAVARWSALRNIVDQTGYWPVVLGGAADLARHKMTLERLAATLLDGRVRFFWWD